MATPPIALQANKIFPLPHLESVIATLLSTRIHALMLYMFY